MQASLPRKKKFPTFAAVATIAVAIAIGGMSQRTPSYMPWHNNAQWERFLASYDAIASQQFANCDSKLVATKFGMTQTHACGNPSHPPVLMLHGADENALSYGDWLVPAAVRDAHHYAIAVDYPCDNGRSIPRDGDVKNCPSTEEEIAEWVGQLLEGLSITKPVTLIGYSYGGFVSFLTAFHRPNLVSNLIFLAPAAVFAPMSLSWLWRAILYTSIPQEWASKRFYMYMSGDPNFDYDTFYGSATELRKAASRVGASTIAVTPKDFDDRVLEQVIADHPTLLVIGGKETVTDSSVAVDRATRAGAQVLFKPQGSHLMQSEHPTREEIKDEVVRFLRQTRKSDI